MDLLSHHINGQTLLLASGAFVAGLIDSIVGGGGLITVPLFMLILGPNPKAIGSNKVAAVFSQFAAASIYWRERMRLAKLSEESRSEFAHSMLARSMIFTALGAAMGAIAAPSFPSWFFKWMMVVIAPIVLTLVLTKRLWTHSSRRPRRPRVALFATTLAGFYDGIAGPGGGTLMFLSLFLIGGYTAETAIADGKFANLASAVASLCFYEIQGNVDWRLGLIAGVPITLGSLLGAKLASKQMRGTETRAPQGARIARIALVIVSLLLLTRFLLASVR